MADVTIRFRHNPRTGKREIVISYESEPDVLPHEHERDHRALVEELLGVPLDGEEIVVERISKAPKTEEPERERGPSGQGRGKREEGTGAGG